MDRDRADAIKQIFAQLALGNRFVGLAIGGSDQAAVGFIGGLATHRAHFLVLQHAQELALGVHRHFGDFVQQERAAFGLAKQAFAIGVGTGKGPFHGTEQLALDQLARQRRAVDLDDSALAARAEGMDEVGDYFLARAALTGNEHGDVAGRNALDSADDLAHHDALEHRRGGAAHGFERAPQHAGFFRVLTAFQRVVHIGQEFL